MFTIKGIDHIVLRTTCLEKMLHFYCDILGCSIERQQSEFHLTQVRAGNNLIDLIEVKNAPDINNQNMEHFCLRITSLDIEALTNYFQKFNINISRYGERYGSSGFGYSFYIKDPQGNEVELQEIK